MIHGYMIHICMAHLEREANPALFLYIPASCDKINYVIS